MIHDHAVAIPFRDSQKDPWIETTTRLSTQNGVEPTLLPRSPPMQQPHRLNDSASKVKIENESRNSLVSTN